MRIVVLADLHAFCSDARRAPDGKKALAPSLIDFSSPIRKPTIDPLVGFSELFRSGEIDSPDLLIVGGDLGDKADTHAIKSAWHELDQVAQTAERAALLATCGNHDLDTRHQQNKFDPRGFLRSLIPSFPYPDSDSDNISLLEFWANNFSVLDRPKYRVLNINSCAFHGFGSEAEPELEHGRISDITLDAIENYLHQSNREQLQKHSICLFHHHLRPVSTDTFEDVSTMKGSERLTDLLSRSEFGEWFIIHGHRHRSNLFCAGGNSGPIVLSCASFAATRTGDENNPSPNQFYVIDLDEPPAGKNARVSGRLQTWNWTPSIGWQSKTSIPGGLPVISGFGFRGYIPELAESLHTAVLGSGRLTWLQTVRAYPQVSRLVPSDTRSLVKCLEALGTVVSEADGQISELARRDV